ncbi:DUF4435 domain-containing protein [Pseudoalteromonas sp. SWYJZ19]|uniref:DUF4435 domain-containing protein n=1 Tax=Pseudoalteromonas sp. SWYJZ19 TaxID=2792068 RepID=UPI00040FF883|nr:MULTISPECIES: DUF4435 domain-containing protein [unclassified Pseudoalteromonas]MBH0052020.1 DUF4435 domain-containing protein [Pseudoalteromonas sp. SWYJZ19]
MLSNSANDIPNYIAKVRISNRKRVLVEGRDDRSHLTNLLDVLLEEHSIKIDVAEDIKGDCRETSKNNRAKIDKVHELCRESEPHQNLFYLIDREFYGFEIDDKIKDILNGEHETIGNYNRTVGHSFENYFIDFELISDAYKYLCGSEYKKPAIILFSALFPDALKIITALSFASKDINKATYSIGNIKWEDFEIIDEKLFFDIAKWSNNTDNALSAPFQDAYNRYLPLVNNTPDYICNNVCRGHTAMIFIQRIFSKCLFIVGEDKDLALRHANNFSSIKEHAISSALSEAWVRKVSLGSMNYPIKLINAFI